MIVFCHLLNDRSGSPTVLHATIQALTEHERGLLFVGSQGRGILEDSGVPIRRYWYRRSRHRLITLFTYLFSQIALYRALSRSVDIPRDATIFVNSLLPCAAMIWGRRTGRRVVVHVHEGSITPAPLRRLLTGCARRCAGLLIYVSKDHRERFRIAGPPTRTVPNPVSSTLAARAVDHTQRQSGIFNVLMLASLRGYKGVEEFMALAAALRDRPDISFELVLNGEPNEVVAFSARYPQASNVTIYSRATDPSEFYVRSDLVVNLSRMDQVIETFGLTLAEAMTFGVPVIAPPVGGPAEIVTHGHDGYCIDSRDVTALRKAVVALADDHQTYASMSRAAKARSRDFTFEAYATALRDALHAAGRTAP